VSAKIAETETAPTSNAAPVEARSRALWSRFHAAIFDDPAILDDIPNGATLVLVPRDDPALAAHELALGQEALAAGRDTYFRHVRIADLPEPPAADAVAPPVGGRRTFFAWDGSVKRQDVVGPDGRWQPVDPPVPVRPLGTEGEE